jgi:phage RecT family recombinase
MRSPIETLLAKRHDFDRFARVFLTVVEANADLVRCTDGSLARAFMHSAQVNLQVGTAYPHAYLIPYWNKDVEVRDANGTVTKGAYEAQFQISVWGYTELLRRAGVRKVWADVVHENDEFECISGTDGKIVKHRPNWFLPTEARGKVLGAYACALLENGETICEPVSFEELMKAKAANRGKSPAWDVWPGQQYQKVAIKRLSKYCPKGEELDSALAIDDDAGSGEVIDVPGQDVTTDYGDSQPANGGAANGPLDEVVARERAQQAATAAAGPTHAADVMRIDRSKLLEQLVAVDERWTGERERVEGWDEFQALSAAAFCNAVFRDIRGNGEPPELPPHLRIFPNDFGQDASGGVIS